MMPCLLLFKIQTHIGFACVTWVGQTLLVNHTTSDGLTKSLPITVCDPMKPLPTTSFSQGTQCYVFKFNVQAKGIDS